MEQAKGDKEARQAWQLRENVTPGLVLDVNDTSKRDTAERWLLPRQWQDEEEGTIFSSGVKIHQGFT